jgi:uncharacterized protein YndB with AHSA1/START domain
MTAPLEKTVELHAPVSRVWQALSDYRQFGVWFRVRLDGSFVVESGFDKFPSDRQFDAFRMNDSGWSEQIENIARHVEQAAGA